MTNENNKQIEAIIFDCDGTLLDTENIYLSTWYILGEKYGYNIPKDMLLETRGRSGEEARRIIFEYMGKDFPLQLFNEERAIRNEAIFQATPIDKLIKPGVMELFDWLDLQGIKIAVASARKYSVTAEHLKHVGLLERAEVVLGRDLVENSKPAPDLFLKAAEIIGVAPENSVVIGDTYSDYLAARAAGMRMIFVPDSSPANEEIEKNAIVLKQVDEAIRVISKTNNLQNPLVDLCCVARIPTPSFAVPEYVAEHPDEEGNYYGPSIGCQGGCFDGRYFYQSFLKYCYNQSEEYCDCHYVNNKKNIVKVIKYDVVAQKVVAVSEEMEGLNHINDITYNSKTGQLVICNSTGNKRVLSFLNAETLKYEGNIILDVELYAADYHEETDRYVLGVSGGRKFSISNSDFTEMTHGLGTVEAPCTYTKQNICCNDEYVYCLYSGKKTAVDEGRVYVYKWNGEFVGVIRLGDCGGEYENLSVYEGTLFVFGGGCLYRIEEGENKYKII